LILRREKEPIRSRFWLLSLLQHTYGFLFLLFALPSPHHVGCLVETFRNQLSIPLWAFPFFYRGFLLWLKYILQDSLLLKQSASHLALSMEEIDHPGTKDLAYHRRRPVRMSRWKEKVAHFFRRHPWTLTWKFEVLSYVVTAALAVLVTSLLFFLDSYVYPAEVRETVSRTIPDPCRLRHSFTMMLVYASITIAMVVVSALNLWKVNDAYYLKTELMLILLVTFFVFPFWVVANLNLFPFYLSAQLWENFMTILFMFISFWFPLIMSYRFQKILDKSQDISSSPSKYPEESKLIRGTEVIYSLVNHPILSFHFERYPSPLSFPS